MMERAYLASAAASGGEAAARSYDVVVVGAGIAGMTAALSLPNSCKVALVSKEALAESSTYKAQGGMAIAVGVDDSPEEHLADTLRVGQGLCRAEAVESLVRQGPAALRFLQSLGADFNHEEDGLALTREAGHGRNRVVHYYDYTGRHLAETLDRQASSRGNIDRLEQAFLVDVLTEDGVCCGCLLSCGGRLVMLRAQAVVIATGGYGGLFAHATNAVCATGDGLAAAYRCGAALADMEFVQFHPTAFTTRTGKAFLLTEALRGEGALLRNAAGERFMLSYHADGELAPRDEVSRAMTSEMQRQKQPHVYLDARHLGKEYLQDRFRQVYPELAQNGYLLERDLIPVAPATHYTIGGIRTDLCGRTTVPGLYACGECAATGVHGANRLASNSLLEGVVFGRAVAQALAGEAPRGSSPAVRLPGGDCCAWGGDAAALGLALDRAAGVVRREEEMTALLERLRQQRCGVAAAPGDVEAYQACNAHQLAELLLEAALLRRESRGTHYRLDYPAKDDVHFHRHSLQQWGKKAVIQ